MTRLVLLELFVTNLLLFEHAPPLQKTNKQKTNKKHTPADSFLDPMA